jgi:hypothetical protein
VLAGLIDLAGADGVAQQIELLGCELKGDCGCHQLASDGLFSCRPHGLNQAVDAAAVRPKLCSLRQYGKRTIAQQPSAAEVAYFEVEGRSGSQPDLHLQESPARDHPSRCAQRRCD